MAHEILSNHKPYPGSISTDINGAGLTGYRAHLNDYKRVVVKLTTTTVGANFTLTFLQYTAATGGSSKALPFTRAKRIVAYTDPATTNAISDVTVAADSLTIASASGNTQQILVEFRASELDIQGGYEWLAPVLSDPAVASRVSLDYIFGENSLPGVDGDII